MTNPESPGFSGIPSTTTGPWRILMLIIPGRVFRNEVKPSTLVRLSFVTLFAWIII